MEAVLEELEARAGTDDGLRRSLLFARWFRFIDSPLVDGGREIAAAVAHARQLAGSTELPTLLVRARDAANPEDVSGRATDPAWVQRMAEADPRTLQAHHVHFGSMVEAAVPGDDRDHWLVLRRLAEYRHALVFHQDEQCVVLLERLHGQLRDMVNSCPHDLSVVLGTVALGCLGRAGSFAKGLDLLTIALDRAPATRDPQEVEQYVASWFGQVLERFPGFSELDVPALRRLADTCARGAELLTDGGLRAHVEELGARSLRSLPDDVADEATARRVLELARACAGRPGASRTSTILLADVLVEHYQASPAPDVQELRRVEPRVRQLLDGDLDPAVRSSARQTHFTLRRLLWEDRPTPEDLDAFAQAAVSWAGEVTDEQPAVLSDVGLLLAVLHDETGDSRFLEAGVDFSARAVDGGAGDTDAARYHVNHSQTLMRRYRRTREVPDHERAQESARAAVALSRSADDQARRLINLVAVLDNGPRGPGVAREVEALRARARSLSSDALLMGVLQANEAKLLDRDLTVDSPLADFRAVDAAARDALGGLDPSSHLHAIALFNLALQSGSIGFVSGDVADFARTADDFRRAAQHPRTSRVTAVSATQGWAKFALLAGEFETAAEAYRRSIEMEGRHVSRGLGSADTQGILASSLRENISGHAAAAFLECGDVAGALRCWESARALLVSRALASRERLGSDLGAGRVGDLLRKLDWTRPEEGEPVPGATGALDVVREALARHRMDGELQELTSSVDDFRLPRLEDHEVVVALCVSHHRSDAIVVRSSGITSLRLPGVSVESVQRAGHRFHAALARAQEPAPAPEGRREAEAVVDSVLRWMWDTVGGPVLDHLRISTGLDPAGPCPRVWWLTSGGAEVLPWHAAGRHSTRFDDAPQTVVDRVVSSCAPSLRAFTHSRRSRGDGPAASPSLLALGVPVTPGQCDLPGARAEIDAIADLFGTDCTVPDARTAESLVTEIAAHANFHFAGHCSVDVVDPSASALLLAADGEGLSFGDVARLDLDAWCCFLSACSTADLRGALPDESLHLATAFQLAGFRHVVATMWTVQDRVALQAAQLFYRRGVLSPGVGAQEVALALNETVRTLRNLRVHQPSSWAGWIHVGG
ncbi:CHAT domain-containing protein [Kineococcus sp. SYSU DK001]|uniref:CHAT domain-containing protein n=1 Tax=Kineococcus sp. SYSU DK001 TaxID=3383122 RepID=UPI003D7E2222